MSLDMRRQRGFLRRRELAWPVTAPRAGTHFAGAPPPNHRLVDVRHADPEQLGRGSRRHPAVNRRQNPRPQILRIALPLPPNHRCPHSLWPIAANHTSSRAESPLSDSIQSGYALSRPAAIGRKENGRNSRFRPSLNREASRLGDVRIRRPSFRALVSETLAGFIGPRKLVATTVAHPEHGLRSRVVPAGIRPASSAKKAMLSNRQELPPVPGRRIIRAARLP